MSDLWTIASTDYEAERNQSLFAQARQATVGVWGVLASAQDHEDYANRKALVIDAIHKECARIAPDYYAPLAAAVEAAYDRDFAVLAAARQTEKDTDDEKRGADDSEELRRVKYSHPKDEQEKRDKAAEEKRLRREEFRRNYFPFGAGRFLD